MLLKKLSRFFKISFIASIIMGCAASTSPAKIAYAEPPNKSSVVAASPQPKSQQSQPNADIRHIQRVTPAELMKWVGYKEERTAQWRGLEAHGRRTGSGELHDMYVMSAAHPYLPAGLYVRLQRPSHKQGVIVKINDKAPNDHIYLSYAAAKALNLTQRNSPSVLLALEVLGFDDNGR